MLMSELRREPSFIYCKDCSECHPSQADLSMVLLEHNEKKSELCASVNWPCQTVNYM